MATLETLSKSARIIGADGYQTMAGVTVAIYGDLLLIGATQLLITPEIQIGELEISLPSGQKVIL